jgi:hypothetical protein
MGFEQERCSVGLHDTAVPTMLKVFDLLDAVTPILPNRISNN